MKFHLLGGVSKKEAVRVQAVYEHTWTVCSQQKCDRAVEAVVLFRGESGQPGHINGMPLCGGHEEEILAFIRSSKGYCGTRTERG